MSQWTNEKRNIIIDAFIKSNILCDKLRQIVRRIVNSDRVKRF